MDCARSIVNELRAAMVRVDSDFSATPFKAKISNAEQLRVHTMLVIGGRDMDAGNVSVRLHGKSNIGAKPKGEVVADILQAIEERRPQTFKFQTVKSILAASPAWPRVGFWKKDSPAVARPRV